MFRPQPMYVTRAVQQAYGIDHPVGDPFGGAAYGEKNGGGSVGKIFSSVIPIVAGAAMMMTPGLQPLGMVIAGGMIAGGAMSGIGAISGNQTLSKIGGITSAVAGVAGLGYSAYTNWDSISNFFASGTELAGTAGTAGSAAESTSALANIPGTGWNVAAAEGATIPGVGEAANFLQQSTPAAFNAASVSGAANLSAPQMNNTMANIPGLSPNTALAQGSSSPLQMSMANTNMSPVGFGSAEPFIGTPAALPSGSFGGVGGATVADAGGSFVGDMLSTGGTGGGLLSSAGQFIKDNPVVSLMGLQTVAGLAEGASPKSQAEGEYLEAMAQLKIAETNYINSGKSKEAEDAFNRAKAYELEKRKAYNDSILNMQQADTSNLYQTMYPGAQSQQGIINQARA